MDQLEDKEIISFFNSTLLNESFAYKHCVLHCKKIYSSHIGFKISENIKEVFENLGVPMDLVHVFLRDNVFKMKTGICM